MTTKREAAHDAVRRGFSVFPITPDSKVPLLKENWLEIATTDHKQVDAWWDKHPDANIAGLTGDKLVFDIDKRHGGLETWAMLKIVEDFPDTLWATTAGGGAHMIYQMPEGQKVKAGAHKAGQGIDIKGGGGYILLPGSTIDDRPYLWGNERPAAFAPQWAIDRFKGGKKKTDTAGKRLVEEDDQARELFANWIRDHAPRAELGEIDDTTYKVAARGYDFGCSQESVHELVTEWNETHCGGAGDAERLEVVVESAGRNRENAIGAKHPAAPGFEAVEIAERPQLKPTHNLAPGQFLTLPAHQGAAMALTNPARPLIKGLLDRGTLSVLYGLPGRGKSFLAMALEYHISTGKLLAGQKVHKGAAIYVAAEGGEGVFARLAALQKHYGDLDTAAMHVLPRALDLLHGPADTTALITETKRLEDKHGEKVEMITLDTVARVMAGGDENSGQDMGAFIKNLDRIRAETGAHVMCIHHAGKNASAGARGHSSLLGAVDTEIEIGDGTITITKQRDMDKKLSLRFTLKSVPIGVDLDGDEVVSCVVNIGRQGDGPDEAMDLPPLLADLLDALDAGLAGDKSKRWGWEFARDSALKTATDISTERTAILRNLSVLSASGYVKKVGRNQWVRKNVSLSVFVS